VELYKFTFDVLKRVNGIHDLNMTEWFTSFQGSTESGDDWNCDSCRGAMTQQEHEDSMSDIFQEHISSR